MKTTFLTTMLVVILTASLYSQSGSINNTLGTGGSFKVKSSTSDSLLVVKDNGNVGIGTSSPAGKLDVAGQLTADRFKVDGVPSFFVTHTVQNIIAGFPDELSNWDESTSVVANDNSGSLNSTTGEFTVPRNGFYFLSAYIEFSGYDTSDASLQVKSGLDFTGLRSTTPTPGTSGSLSIAGVVKLLSGAVVTVVLFKTGFGSYQAGEGYFSGYLVSDF